MQFQPVTGDGGNGAITVLRGGKLITITNGAKAESELANGTTLEGVYSGSSPNKFNPERVDYSLRSNDGTLIILAQTASLKAQFDKVSEGELVQVVFNGKRSITRKNGAKAEMYDFTVLRAVDAE